MFRSPKLVRRILFTHSIPLALLVALTAFGAAGCRKANQTAELPAVEDDADAPEQAESQSAPEPQRAEAGVGRQGQSLEDETGIGAAIAQPAKSLFSVKQRTVFEIQIPQAMQLYEATNGRKPESHEEFMQQIIQANRIKLPELPEGQEYRYEPEKGELWVHPTEQAS